MAGHGQEADIRRNVVRLTRSNFAPTDIEIAFIREQIQRASVIIAGDGTHIRNGFSLSKIWHERKINQARGLVSQYTAVLSPVRRLPPELVQEVFLHYFYGSAGKVARFVAARTPWAPSQVCRSWRKNALSLPVIWTCIPVVMLLPGKPAMFRELLRRSQDAPLDIAFYFPNASDFNTLPPSHPIHDLVRHCDRWQYLTIHDSDTTILAFEALKMRLSALTHLCITGSASEPQSAARVLYTAFERAPRLRCVTLDMQHTRDVKLPYSQITHYTDLRALQSRIAKILGPSLEALYIRTWVHDAPLGATITLPRLRRLRIVDEGHSVHHASFINEIDTPALEILETTAVMLFALTRMLSSSIGNHASGLTTLIVKDVRNGLDAARLRVLFEYTPNLERLCVTGITAAAMQGLCSRDNRANLLPQLQVADFFGTFVFALGDGPFRPADYRFDRWIDHHVQINLYLDGREVDWTSTVYDQMLQFD